MKIAIIGAMEQEVEILRSRIEEPQVEVIANCEYTAGKIGKHDVVLLKSGIGKVNAAMSTTVLLDRYQPDVVINTGSAGGFHHELNVGDVVISSEVRHHDVDVTIFNYEYGQVPGLPAAFKADEKLVQLAKDTAMNIEGVQVAEGLIATGDSFMNDPARVEAVRNSMGDIFAVEMEAAAVAQVCYQFGVPFVVIRALSDIAGKESNISFDQFLETAAKHSTEHVLAMLEKME
ncbi:MAG: 5'-methylthioadenosine/S-adenosylhomocysteine nucleosidase [Bacillaceae bacterium]